MCKRINQILFSIIITIIIIRSDIFLIKVCNVYADDPPPDDGINGYQYINGDWNVGDIQTYTDEIIILSGNLTISNGGNLTLHNVTLMMNNTNINAQYNIEVLGGGTLDIMSGSIITDSPYDIDDDSSSDFGYMFWVREGSNFTMKDSELHECGWYWYSGGLVVFTDRVSIDNNLIQECYNIELRGSSYSTITNNRIINSSYAGINLINSHNTTITHNEINGGDFGISLDWDSENNIVNNNEIYNNNFSGIILNQRSSKNIISENIIHHSKYGIYYSGEYYHHSMVINKNIIYNNSIAGLHLVGWKNISSENSNHEGNIFYNNSCGIDIYSSYNTFFKNTTINNNDIGIRISGSNNINLINTSISNSKDYDIYFGNFTLDSGELNLLNTTFNKSKVFFEENRSNLTVQWYLHVFARDLNGTPIPGASVEVRNSKGELVKSGITDENGFLKWIVITEYIQNITTSLSFNPHNISVVKGDLILYANPEPFINQTMQVNIPTNILKSEEKEENIFYIGVLLVIILIFIFAITLTVHRKKKHNDKDNNS